MEGEMIRAAPRPLYLRERALVAIVEKAGWAPGPVWMGMRRENTSPTPGFVFPDRSARSDLLYRVGYPGLTQISLKEVNFLPS